MPFTKPESSEGSCHMNAVHTLSPYMFKTNFSNIRPSMYRSPNESLSFCDKFSFVFLILFYPSLVNTHIW
jgi:hypothetical protein